MRDRLATIRTSLANERTVLAYLRIGLALCIGAATARELVEDPTLRAIGAVLTVIGLLTLVFGVWRFLIVRREIDSFEKQ